jgi:anti-sigma-K factor RskA
MNDERHEELAALYALGALPEAEARAFAEVLAGDPELQALVRELQATTAALAQAVPPLEPPPQLEAQLLARIRAERPAALPEHRDRRWLGWAALAAGLAVAATLLTVERTKLASEVTTLRTTEGQLTSEAAKLGLERAQLAQEIGVLLDREAQAGAREARSAKERTELQKERTELQNEIARLATERARLEGELATLQKKDVLASLQIRTLNAQLAESREALAAVVWNQDTQRGVLAIDKLKPAGPKQDYQLWVINALTPAPVSAGLIPVNAKGEARYEFKADAPVGVADKFAISREKKGGGTKPEGPILFISP